MPTSSKNMNTSILTIDPGTKYWGVAVFSGEEIIYWKVKNLSAKDSQESRLFEVREIVRSLCRKFTPQILVLRSPLEGWERQSPYLQKVFREIKRVGKDKGIKIFEYAPSEIGMTVCKSEFATRKQLGDEIGRQYPEFADYLGNGEKQKDKQRWGRTVNGIALGLCYLMRRGH